MTRVVFVKTNYGRKKKFQIRTLGVKEGGSIKFRKEPMNSVASSHLNDMVATKKMLDNFGKSKYFVDVNKNGTSIDMDMVEGKGLEDLIVDAILDGNEKQTLKLLDTYEDIIYSISKVARKTDKPPELYGSKVWEYFPSKRAICPGLIDLNFDNIIISEKGSKIIDYEWSFDGAVPADFVLYRAIMWLSIRYSGLFRLNSKKVEFVSLSDNMVLPKYFFSEYRGLLSYIQKSYELERDYFQPWVNPETLEDVEIVLGDESRPPVFALEELAAARRSNLRLSSEIDSIVAEKDTLTASTHQLEEDLEILGGELAENKRVVDSLINSKSYKLGRAMSFPFRFIKKLLNK